jgi:hypothetical protein
VQKRRTAPRSPRRRKENETWMTFCPDDEIDVKSERH